jgi:phosphotransferase system HPr (HPr) family protein
MDQPHKLRRPLVRQVVVNHPNGVHVRPSTAIVKTVRRFQSSVRIQYQDREADAAEILDILALRVPQNAELVLLAEGLDAAEVLDALVKLFAEDFGMSGK